MSVDMISVVLPVHNAEESIKEAIEAVLYQDYPCFELIISDDCCSDGSRKIIESFHASDERVKVVSSAHRLGVSHARNLALDVCRGTYVAFVDADDVPAPNWLSTLVSSIEGVDLAACGYDVMDATDQLLYSTADRSDVAGEDGMCTLDASQFVTDLFSNRLMYQGYVWNKLFRRDLLEVKEPLRFKQGVAYNEDRLFIFNYLKRCCVVRVDMKPVYAYHSHPGADSYDEVQATELGAFDEMLTDLKNDVELGSNSALFYAEKDYFRAAVELYDKASAAKSADAEWLGQDVNRFKAYKGEFLDYPTSFQEKIQRVVSEVKADS